MAQLPNLGSSVAFQSPSLYPSLLCQSNQRPLCRRDELALSHKIPYSLPISGHAAEFCLGSILSKSTLHLPFVMERPIPTLESYNWGSVHDLDLSITLNGVQVLT